MNVWPGIIMNCVFHPSFFKITAFVTLQSLQTPPSLSVFDGLFTPFSGFVKLYSSLIIVLTQNISFRV